MMIKNLLLKVGNKHRFILKINMIFAENNIINLKMKKSIKNIIIIIMLINNLLNSYKINLNKMNLNDFLLEQHLMILIEWFYYKNIRIQYLKDLWIKMYMINNCH